MPEDPAKPAESAPEAAPAPSPRPQPVEGGGGSGGRGWVQRLNPINLFKRETPQRLVRQAAELLENRNYAQATVTLKRALELDTQFVPAFEGLGDVLMKKGGRANVEAALEQYGEAIRRDPLQEKIYGARARAYDMLGKRKEAALEKKKMVVVKTLQAEPGNPVANNNMGILFLQQNLVAQAVDYFQRAVSSDAKYDVALRNLAVTYYKLASEAEEDGAQRAEHLDKAKSFISRALEIAETPQSLLALARMHMVEEQWEDALSTCERVEQIDATLKDVFGLKKTVLMKLNRLEEAKKAYETFRFLASHE